MRRFAYSLPGRALALCLCALSGPLSCVPPDLLEPRAGIVDFERPALVPVPGGLVNAAAGNLIVGRHAIDADTILGTWSIDATWNAADGRWSWSHRMAYDGRVFRDASGARHDVSGLPDGAPLPGTHWTRVDADTLRTRGGLEHHFSGEGRLAEVRWATLDHPRIVLSDTQIAQCTAPGVCTPLFDLVPGPDGQPAAISDRRDGREARFAYDASGRLVEARSPFDVARGTAGTTYEYGAVGALLSATTTPEGERIEYAYQPGGRIDTVTQVGEGDPRHVFRYAGRLGDGRYRSFHKNPLGGVTRYEFDDRRRLLRTERDGTGDVVVREWSGLRPSRVVRPGGVVTTLAYAGDDLVQRVDPSGNVVVLERAPGAIHPAAPLEAPLARVEDGLGLVLERVHDASGRPVLERNGAGEESALGWLGSVVAWRTERGVTTTYTGFGGHGHWTTAEIAGHVASRRAFDAAGNLAVPGPESRPGGTLGRGFDPARRVERIARAASDADGRVVASAEVRVVRRSDGRLLAIERPGGGDHAIDYDALGRAVAVRERVAGTWQATTLTYDAAGNQVARERANGMREEWEYDAFGRMLRHRALRDGALEGEAAFFWAGGRLVARYDSVRDLAEVYAYDAAGRLASTAFGHGETITREYDLRDRLVAEVFTVPGFGVVADVGYAYDAAGRLVRLVDRAAGAVLVEDVWEQGLPRETVTGNGLVRAYQLDAQRLVVGMETRDAGGGVVETTTVTRATASAPPRYEISSATTTPLASSEEHYWLPPGTGLANPDQRVGKRVFGWHDGEGAVRRYAWDALGNAADDGTGNAFVHDATGSRLLEARFAEGGGVQLGWDEAGFATSRDGVPIAWTATGRLARHGDDRLVWDMAGRLVEATLGGVTRRYLRFGGRIESDLTHVGWLDLGPVAIELGGAGRRYRHLDFRGNVGFVSDETGAVVAHHRYHPFGRDASWGPAPEGPAFEHRPAFGPFVLLGERVLEPAVGRFLSPDPVLGAVNQYAYALGNPVWFEDRDGREMTNRQAWQFGLLLLGVALAVVALSTGLGLVPTTAIIVQAALRSGAVVGFVGAVVNAIVSTLDALEGSSPSGPRQRPPEPPSAPEPAPAPAPDAAPPQLKSIELDVLEVRVCTPLGRTGPGPWTLLLLLIAQAVAFGVWWRRGPEVAS